MTPLLVLSEKVIWPFIPTYVLPAHPVGLSVFTKAEDPKLQLNSLQEIASISIT